MLGGDESTQVTAGIGGFLVLFGLALACFFLFRSMNNHIRRMTFEEREQDFRSRDGEGDAPADDDPIGGRPSR